jgi:nucleoside-diphosphate-sugar epimerase
MLLPYTTRESLQREFRLRKNISVTRHTRRGAQRDFSGVAILQGNRSTENTMRVCVTGCNGYLGSMLTPELMRREYDVVGLDTGFYSDRALYRDSSSIPMTIVKDLRLVEQKDLEGLDAVVHMAELSNDPVGQLAPNITYEINHKASVRLAELSKKAGVKRFVYMSSCSVYGVASQDFVDEESPVNPQTAYGECKTLVERDVKAMASEAFSPTFMRNATAYGASPRMRFDIVLNNLAGLAWTTKKIAMTSDGTPWRPLVHGLDICQAIIAVLEAPLEAVANEVFNVGDTEHNYRVKEIAEIVAEVFPGCEVSFGPPSPDNRSYRVSFEKIRKYLPGFKCRWDARRGAQQLLDLFRRVDMTEEVFQYRTFTRLKQLEHLTRTRQIDKSFFWTEVS